MIDVGQSLAASINADELAQKSASFAHLLKQVREPTG